MINFLTGQLQLGEIKPIFRQQDSAAINQDTGKPDVSTTTAICLLLDQAASVDEALAPSSPIHGMRFL